MLLWLYIDDEEVDNDEDDLNRWEGFTGIYGTCFHWAICDKPEVIPWVTCQSLP